VILEKGIKYKIFGAFEETILCIWKSLPYVEGFKYYAVENKKFIVILNQKIK
jgi:hypothetical protein